MPQQKSASANTFVDFFFFGFINKTINVSVSYEFFTDIYEFFYEEF